MPTTSNNDDAMPILPTVRVREGTYFLEDMMGGFIGTLDASEHVRNEIVKRVNAFDEMRMALETLVTRNPDDADGWIDDMQDIARDALAKAKETP